MRTLIRELIPHAPEFGLFVSPDIPSDRLENALRDYAKDVSRAEVIALYDATLLKSAKDGAVFTADRLVFQNNDLQTPQVVRYSDIVQVGTKKKLLGGKRVLLEVNRGRATVELSLDFSGRPEAAEHVARFLSEAILVKGDGEHALGTRSGVQEAEEETSDSRPVTDAVAVRHALDRLVADGLLLEGDRDRLLDVLR